MKAFVIVLVIVYLGQETNAKPQERLDMLIRELHRRQGDCDALAGHLDKYINWRVNRQQRSPAFIRDMIERVTGINLLNPNELRRVVCRMTEASTQSELKAALNELGITLHGMTAVYNYAVGYVPSLIAGLEREKEWAASHDQAQELLDGCIHVLNVLQESHLLGFDPEGTQWFVDNILFRGPGEHGPGRTSRRSGGAFFRRSGEEELCENLFTALNNLLTVASGGYPGGHFATAFEEFWGFNPLDEDQLRSIVCDVAGVTSIEELIEVLDNRGTLGHVFSFHYQSEVTSMEYEKHYLESIQQEAEQSEWQREWAALSLPVIYGLEEAGLLSLENDLVEQ